MVSGLRSNKRQGGETAAQIRRFIQTTNRCLPEVYFSDDDGVLDLEFDLLAKIGQATFQDGRIRSCLCCCLLFYAKRQDAECCSPVCANRARTLRWRDKKANGRKKSREA